MAYASVIGSSSVIRGNVSGDSSLEILGRVEGDVGVTGDLALGADAVVVGAISGARIVIGGSVEGDVTASEAVVVTETGRVVGDLSAPRIGMSEGALVRGSVRTDGVPASNRSSAARNTEARAAGAAAPVERSAPRPLASVAPAAHAGSTAHAVSAHSAAPTQSAAIAKPVAKKAPPPPVIQAPRAGARARKRMLKR